MTTPERLPLDSSDLQPRLAGRWQLAVVGETGSTNADLLAAAGDGAPAGSVLVAELQTSGRGRMDRSWQSVTGAGLTFSMLLRPSPPRRSWAWLPLLTGLALAEAIGGDARLKWPNDLLLGANGAKAAGILLQAAEDAAVVGVGLNVSTTRAELPVPEATSLAIAGHHRLDRGELLVDFLDRFGARYQAWQDADGDAVASGLAAGYRAACASIGCPVSVQLSDRSVAGRALAVDDEGCLLVQPDDGGAPVAVAAGDVTHLRADSR